MKLYVDKFYDFLARPLFKSSRLVLVGLCVPLALCFTQPIWRISMEAPQYRNGLYLDIYTYKIEGGNNGQHLQEINLLNHYIGMRKLDRAAMSDLDWLPFALGALLILALRVAAIGNVRSLIDLLVLSLYVSGFAFARFVFTLYKFGHELDPEAPVKTQPFTPAIFGSKQIANFMTHSFPSIGSAFLCVFVSGVVGVTLWHLIAGRRAALKEQQRPLVVVSPVAR